MIFKLFIALAAALALATAALAQSATEIITVSHLTGDDQKVALASVGKIRLGETEADILLKDNTTVALGAISNISRISFGMGELTAEAAPSAALSVAVGPNPATDAITISGLEAGSDIALIDRSGRAVIRQVAQAESVTLSLTALPADVYILIAAGETFKIVKK